MGDARARLDRDVRLFDDGRRALKMLIAFVQRNTQLEGSLIGVHNETRALLMESSFGYAVVFGKRGPSLGPLGELLLATHQLDWRLGERAIAYSRLSESLVEAPLGVRAALDAYVEHGSKATGAALKSRDDLAKRCATLGAKRKSYLECKPARGAAAMRRSSEAKRGRVSRRPLETEAYIRDSR